MGKKKIYVIIVALIIAVIFSASAICNQCGMPVDEEGKIDVREEEDTETPAEESEGSEDIEESDGDDEKAKPTIKLEIYEGPTPAPGNVCYYRVEAIVTGNPEPKVKFSKDDSNKAWGPKKAQVNLIEGETFILEVTATNSEGVAEKNISLSWVYNEEGVAVAVLGPSNGEEGNGDDNGDEGNGDGDEGDGDDDGPPTTTDILDAGPGTGCYVTVNGDGEDHTSTDIVKIGSGPDGFYEGLLYFHIAELKGKEIQSASLKINEVTAYDPRDEYEELGIYVNYQLAINLDSSTTNMDYNGDVLLDNIELILADDHTVLGIILCYKQGNFFAYSGEDFISDEIDHGISFLPENAKLEVTYLK